MAFKILNKVYMRDIYRNLHAKFDGCSFYNSQDLRVHTDKKTKTALRLIFLILIKNICMFTLF